MAWDEQRRMRGAHGQDTAKLAGMSPRSPEAAPPPSGMEPGESGWEHWGRRFGWLVAVGLSVTALLVSVIALSSAGPTGAGFRHGGRGTFAVPGNGNGNGFQTPQQNQPAFPAGPGYGQGYGSR